MLRSLEQSAPPTYGLPAQAFHWAGAILIVAVAWAGYTLSGLSAFQKLQQIPLHKSLGFALFTLTAVRLAWRMGHAPPALPGTMKKWDRRVAVATHAMLYFLMLAVPVTGWLMSSALGLQTVPFGWFPLPDMLPRDRELGETLKGVHFIFNKSLLALAAFHVLAVVKHALVDRDSVMRRMLPVPSRRP